MGPDFSRFSLSLAGGYGLTSGHQGLLDLKTEVQFGLSSRFRIGLGVGYIAGDERQGLRPDGRNQPGIMMPFSGRGSEDIRLIPLSVNVYYILPLGPHWSVFVSGGGSLYFAELRDLAGSTHRSVLGGQGGLGVEYHISHGVSFVAEGSYRILDFRRFARTRPDDTPAPAGLGDFSTYFSESPHHPGVNLRGLSLRFGLKINL
jgi:hypothetical protein